jgi:undecaprenyl-diphosphatase
MDIVSGVLLGTIQGLTEFLPVSSSGHLILARGWLGLTDTHGLAFDAVLQLATAFAVGIYFFKDLLNVAYTALYKVTKRPVRKEDERLLWALVAGTIPAIVIGLFLEEAMETVFRSATLVAYTLIAGSLVMVCAEYVLKRHTQQSLEEGVNTKKGFLVGLFQCLALVPGMSRSGMTISGLKKFLELFLDGSLSTLGIPLALASLAAFLSGIAAIHFLLKFLRTHSLWPFIVYRVLLAGVILLVL